MLLGFLFCVVCSDFFDLLLGGGGGLRRREVVTLFCREISQEEAIWKGEEIAGCY